MFSIQVTILKLVNSFKDYFLSCLMFYQLNPFKNKKKGEKSVLSSEQLTRQPVRVEC